MIKNQNYSSNANDILKSDKNFYEKLYTKDRTSKTTTAEIFSKISNRKKISNKQLHHCKANNFIEKDTKSINCKTNIKYPGNDSITATFYKHLLNELSPIL